MRESRRSDWDKRHCMLISTRLSSSTIASQITSLTIVYLTVYSGANQRKHQSFASLAFVRGIRRGPVNSSRKGPVTRKMFPFDDVIMTANMAICHENNIRGAHLCLYYGKWPASITYFPVLFSYWMPLCEVPSAMSSTFVSNTYSIRLRNKLRDYLSFKFVQIAFVIYLIYTLSAKIVNGLKCKEHMNSWAVLKHRLITYIYKYTHEV